MTNEKNLNELNLTIKTMEENIQVLEAGCQRPLRFRIERDRTIQNSIWYRAVLLNKDNKPETAWNSPSWDTRVRAIQDTQKRCDCLNLPCEFIEGEGDTEKSTGIMEPARWRDAMNNNHPTGLWLGVCSEEYEVPCRIYSQPDQDFGHRCFKIGTGTRSVRLVGKVADCTAWAVFGGGSGDDDLFTGYEAGYFDEPGHCLISTGGDSRESVEEAFDALAEIITQAFRTGTLPPELYQSETNPEGLREVECDDLL